jgi:hypothetical protein
MPRNGGLQAAASAIWRAPLLAVIPSASRGIPLRNLEGNFLGIPRLRSELRFTRPAPRNANPATAVESTG